MATKANKFITYTSVAAIGAGSAFIMPWEGLFTKPYRDIVGVWTVCYGETAADHVTMKPYTSAECKAMLPEHLKKGYATTLDKCIGRPVPLGVAVLGLSAGYNLGAGTVCHSAYAKYAKAGKWANACYGLLGYDHAGGRRIEGLTNRREAEKKFCLKNLD